MKKVALLLPVVALAACGQETKTLISDCELIETPDTASAYYKCPMSEELAAIQTMEANAMFNSVEGLNMEEVVADAEHVYVNVYGTCETEGQVQYRIMVKEPKIDGTTMYAVAVCQ